MIVLFVVVAMAIVGAVAVLVVRDRPLLLDDPVQGRAFRWVGEGDVEVTDLAEVRFAVTLRGYRMAEVDRVLADTREALIARDTQLARLRELVRTLGGQDPAGAGSDPDQDAGGAHEVSSLAPVDSVDRP